MSQTGKPWLALVPNYVYTNEYYKKVPPLEPLVVLGFTCTLLMN